MIRKLNGYLLIASLFTLPLSVYGQMKWNCETASGGFGKRNSSQGIEYKGKLWLVAGYNLSANTPIPNVWYSSNCKDWIKMPDTLPHSIRTEFSMVVLHDTLYTIGGYQGC